MGSVVLSLVVLALLAPGLPARAHTSAPSVLVPTAVGACSSLPGATTTVFLPNVTKTLGGPTGWVTPFIVQNIGTRATDLEVSFYRFADGGLATCRRITGLAPGTSFADVPNNDPDLPSDTQFSVVVRSYGAAVVAVVNEHQSESIPGRAEALSYVGLTEGTTRVGLPFVAKHVDGWLTTFVIQNLGAGLAQVSAHFESAQGDRSATLTRLVGPGRSQFVDPTVEPALIDGTEYAVIVTADQPIAVIVNAHNDAAGVAAPRGFSYNGVASGSPGESWVPLVARAAGIGAPTSRLSVLNTAGTAAAPTLSFQRLGTSAIVTIAGPMVAPGRAWIFDPRFLSDGVTSCSPGGGTNCIGEGEWSLRVTGGAFAVLAAVDTPVTAMAFTGQARPGNRAYLPNVTRTLGGTSGWTTPFVVQSAGATSVNVRWYRFSDGALVTRQQLPALVTGSALRVDPRTVGGLSDDTQYAVIVDGVGGDVAAIVTELNFRGGDGAMAYEGFPATVSTVPTASSMTVSPSIVTLSVGEIAQFRASVRDQFDTEMTATVSWSVSAPSVGSISASGVFTAGASPADGSIVASVANVSASAAVSVTPAAPVPPAYAPITYADGWKVTIVQFSEQSPGPYDTPDPGMRFVAMTVRYDNGTSSAQHFNPYDFDVRDGWGVRRSQTFFLGRNDGLHSGSLAPGGFVSGSVVFEVPIGDKALRLIYDGGSAHRQAELDLLAGSPYPAPPPLYPPAVYSDGWKLGITQFAEQSPGPYDHADPGMRFVLVVVRFDNGSTTTRSFNPFDFELRDGAGVRRTISFFLSRNDDLHSGDLMPGQFVSGAFVFQAPIGDHSLQLIYSSFHHAQFAQNL